MDNKDEKAFAGKTAIVTGANRGIGYEVARELSAKGFRVVLACRSLDKAKGAADKLEKEGFKVLPMECDVSSEPSIQKFVKDCEAYLDKLDVLVNNAGIFVDPYDATGSVFQAPVSRIQKSLNTNVFGPFLLIQGLVSLMKGSGRIVNLSSGMGQLSEMGGGCPAYRISKTALNALTRIFSEELKGTRIKVNSVCPGWVKTDMGGANATRPVEKGAETVVWCATLPDSGPTGGFFRDKEPIAW